MLLTNKRFKFMLSNKGITPLKAIKKHCLECSGYEKKQVRECVIKDCVLFPFRQGSNPNRKGIGGKKIHNSTHSSGNGDISVQTA